MPNNQQSQSNLNPILPEPTGEITSRQTEEFNNYENEALATNHHSLSAIAEEIIARKEKIDE